MLSCVLEPAVHGRAQALLGGRVAGVCPAEPRRTPGMSSVVLNYVLGVSLIIWPLLGGDTL